MSSENLYVSDEYANGLKIVNGSDSFPGISLTTQFNITSNTLYLKPKLWQRFLMWMFPRQVNYEQTLFGLDLGNSGTDDIAFTSLEIKG